MVGGDDERGRAALFDGYLADARTLVLEQIRAMIPGRSVYGPVLYDLVLDYPLREAKALRPALCIAVCRAMGGRLEAVLPSAAVLELYHNAFLIHDDVEDESLLRRGRATLHEMRGVPVAVNVGDAMLAMTLEPLLDNMGRIGLGRALRVMQVIARMARISAEGQALELDWIARNDWSRTDRDYVRMVYQKTCWYTFIAPVLIAGIVAGCDDARLRTLGRFAMTLGVAFQIHDDVLNLRAVEERYGKEIAGDLWEGKHTLILLHALRHAEPGARARAIEVLGRPRRRKSSDDVAYLSGLVDRLQSTQYACSIAGRWAGRARDTLGAAREFLAPSVHFDFLAHLVDFVVSRDR